MALRIVVDLKKHWGRKFLVRWGPKYGTDTFYPLSSWAQNAQAGRYRMIIYYIGKKLLNKNKTIKIKQKIEKVANEQKQEY